MTRERRRQGGLETGAKVGEMTHERGGKGGDIRCDLSNHHGPITLILRVVEGGRDARWSWILR